MVTRAGDGRGLLGRLRKEREGALCLLLSAPTPPCQPRSSFPLPTGPVVSKILERALTRMEAFWVGAELQQLGQQECTDHPQQGWLTPAPQHGQGEREEPQEHSHAWRINLGLASGDPIPNPSVGSVASTVSTSEDIINHFISHSAPQEGCLGPMWQNSRAAAQLCNTVLLMAMQGAQSQRPQPEWHSLELCSVQPAQLCTAALGASLVFLPSH